MDMPGNADNQAVFTPARNSEFMDGAHGGDQVGGGTYSATSIQQNVSPMFHPAGLLGIPNSYHPQNGMSESTYARAEPNDNYYSQLSQSAAGGNSVMNT